MTAGFSRSTLAVVLAALLFGIAGCAMRTATTPQPLADAERAAIADTVRQLYRESSRTFDSDLDCGDYRPATRR